MIIGCGVIRWPSVAVTWGALRLLAERAGNRMCNRAHSSGEPETLFARFDVGGWLNPKPMMHRKEWDRHGSECVTFFFN
jgi:hypothetical protein